MEYNDEEFCVGDDVIRVWMCENGRQFPEVRGKITNVYRDGVRIQVQGMPFFLSFETYAKSWLFAFDFYHLEYVFKSFPSDDSHLELLIESWGEQLVLAAARTSNTAIYYRVMELCQTK
jgi:hypothetical protein